ncbi:hypothetical protein PCANC_24678 [Puccinia coronata f. sp. avenae]|uniref:Uncharacterized protein n=1 Tax=Puccinia coronata f. sp. avenae TaxID=200324 RepID=A0A2N5TYY5_9BASI|nr:hypothetical protein PCANC_24678 [Puccinia coronata f. sp. avenae]
MTDVISSNGTSDDPPPDPIYSSEREREEIENWRDSIAERLWEQYSTTFTAGINRSNTAVRAVLEQPCSTGGRTGTVRPKHLPAGRTGLSDQFLGPVAQDQPGPVGQICPTSWLSLRSDSVRPNTGRTRLFEHRSSSRVRPVNAGSDCNCADKDLITIEIEKKKQDHDVVYCN